MNITPEEIVNALLEENKRLTLENLVLKMTLQKLQEQEAQPTE